MAAEITVHPPKVHGNQDQAERHELAQLHPDIESYEVANQAILTARQLL